MSGEMIIAALVGGGLAALILYLAFGSNRGSDQAGGEPAGRVMRSTWRMPPLTELPPRQLTALHRVWLLVLRAYLIIAAGLVLVRIITPRDRCLLTSTRDAVCASRRT